MLAAALEEEASGFLGREAPLLAVGDGALGLWSALDAVFSAVRLRTDVARRMKRRNTALHLVFKAWRVRKQVVALRLSERWRPLNGGRNLMGLLVDGARFEDGIPNRVAGEC